MFFEEFQHLARLYIVGALDPDEMEQFCAGRQAFGAEAEAFIDECRKLNAVFALSLRPCEPDPRTKGKLLARIKEASAPKENGVMPEKTRRIDLLFALSAEAVGKN